MSSRDAVALTGELARAVGRDLPATLLWETGTVDGLVRRLGTAARPVHSAEPLMMRTSLPEPSDEPIAVVGVGCRLPGGVRGPADYWRLLMDGTDAVGAVPDGRWADFPEPPPDTHRRGGYLGPIDEIAAFDAEFFRISPSEAAAMDPQQRMLLEVVHEALDHAAIPAASSPAPPPGSSSASRPTSTGSSPAPTQPPSTPGPPPGRPPASPPDG